jgi:hypothetical protein
MAIARKGRAWTRRKFGDVSTVSYVLYMMMTFTSINYNINGITNAYSPHEHVFLKEVASVVLLTLASQQYDASNKLGDYVYIHVGRVSLLHTKIYTL